MNTHAIPGRSALLCLCAALAACGGDNYIPRFVGRQVIEEEATQATVAAAPSPTAGPMASAGPTALVAERERDSERYAPIAENGFLRTLDRPLSTFSTDVDTASYANVRRFLDRGQRPPPDAVRIEELVNYFSYDYQAPSGEHPIGITSELADSPFDPGKQLLRVGLYARAAARVEAPARNLVFLLDVSGSMADPDKLPLVTDAMSMLTRTLGERDRIAIVTYAGSSGVVLSPTPGHEHARIEAALRSLRAEGSTNGASGIELAYDLALEGLRPNAVNRVILATDGDFNVGVTDRASLLRLIERRRDQGIYLTVLGVGMGNLKDDTMELLADHGNGNYAYLDTRDEARKVLIDEAASTLEVVAKDVKVQLEWNPTRVASYRLIGYENRRLPDQDFADDTKDAGDLGDGHRVTALYELEPTRSAAGSKAQAELVTIAVRYKRPGASASQLLSAAVVEQPRGFDQASDDLRFAAAVAGFGMLLRGSQFAGGIDFDRVAHIAGGALGRDQLGYRRELLALVSRARQVYEQ